MAAHDATNCPWCQPDPPELRRALAEGELPTDYEPTKERTLPKMRGIKQDLWSNEDFSEVSFGARLLFIGLWNFVCDNGHHKDKPRQLRIRIFPNDIDVDVSPLLDELVQVGLVARADGWVTVPNLRKHQNIDFRYFVTCDHPNCEEPEETKAFKEKRRRGSTLAPKEDAPSARRADGERSPVALYEGEGEGDVKTSNGEGDVKGAAKPSRTRRTPTTIPDDFSVTPEMRAWAATNTPAPDVNFTTDEFIDYWKTEGQKKSNWELTWKKRMRTKHEDMLARGWKPPKARAADPFNPGNWTA